MFWVLLETVFNTVWSLILSKQTDGIYCTLPSPSLPHQRGVTD